MARQAAGTPPTLEFSAIGNELTNTETPKPQYRPRIDLPYETPPLSMNSRYANHGHRARATKEVRNTGAWLAKAARLPKNQPRAIVTLHYRPDRNRKIDTINLSATTKALVDGLVDYGMTADDNHTIVSTPEPVIHPAEKGRKGALWLTIEFPESDPT